MARRPREGTHLDELEQPAARRAPTNGAGPSLPGCWRSDRDVLWSVGLRATRERSGVRGCGVRHLRIVGSVALFDQRRVSPPGCVGFPADDAEPSAIARDLELGEAIGELRGVEAVGAARNHRCRNVDHHVACRGKYLCVPPPLRSQRLARRLVTDSHPLRTPIAEQPRGRSVGTQAETRESHHVDLFVRPGRWNVACS